MENLSNFIRNTEFNQSKITLIPGDASLRKYYRLLNNQKSAIIMDTSDCIRYFKPFILYAKYLREFNILSPEIYKTNFKQGLALIEDFGDNTLYNYIEMYQDEIQYLYKAVIDEFISFQTIPYKPIFNYLNTVFLKKELQIFLDWYLQYKNIKLYETDIKKFWDSWAVPLEFLKENTKEIFFVHKDFHGGNLMILPNQRIGIIDFQAAKFGNQIYDLVSFLYDCRQNIPETILQDVEDYFLFKTKLNKPIFNTVSKIFIVQRNLKILGNFSRIYLNYSNSKYLQYLEPAWKLIAENINISIFDDLNSWLNINIKNKEYVI